MKLLSGFHFATQVSFGLLPYQMEWCTEKTNHAREKRLKQQKFKIKKVYNLKK